MAALPYIQFYVADYLADTMHLNTEEHGAYLLIIMNYWQTGKAVKKSKLPSITRLSNERWTVVEPTLNEFFNEDENGYWHHLRIEADLEKVHSKSVQASIAGKASAAKRAENKAKTSKANSSGRSNPVQRKSNHTDTDTDTDTDIIKQKKKASIPKDFCLSDDLIKYAKGLNVTSISYLEDFTNNFILSCKAKDYKYSDFGAAWKNWFRKEIKERPPVTNGARREFPV